MLLKNSSIKMNNDIKNTGDILGTEEARTVFYNNQNNSNDAFIFIKGTEEEVNNYL